MLPRPAAARRRAESPPPAMPWRAARGGCRKRGGGGSGRQHCVTTAALRRRHDACPPPSWWLFIPRALPQQGNGLTRSPRPALTWLARGAVCCALAARRCAGVARRAAGAAPPVLSACSERQHRSNSAAPIAPERSIRKQRRMAAASPPDSAGMPAVQRSTSGTSSRRQKPSAGNCTAQAAAAVGIDWALTEPGSPLSTHPGSLQRVGGLPAQPLKVGAPRRGGDVGPGVHCQRHGF